MLIYLNRILLFLLTTLSLEANIIDINKKEVSLLEHSSVYFDEENLSPEEIIKRNLFKPYLNSTVNTSTHDKVVWIKLSFQNKTDKSVKRILLFSSAILEHIYLYKSDNLTSPTVIGEANLGYEHNTLLHYHSIELGAMQNETYYLKVFSNYAPVNFTLTLHEEEAYIHKDKLTQFFNIFLVGIIAALILYSGIIGTYEKNRSYLYYSLYLFILLYHQITYLGFVQIYLPISFTTFNFDMSLHLIYILIITSALYSMSFLQTVKYPKIEFVYRTLIVITLLLMLFISEINHITMSITMFLSFLLIIYNIFAGVYIYIKGEKFARLYIVGFSVVFLSYLILILDSAGITSIMQNYQNTLLVATTFEALILSLAFSDRYKLLQKEKGRIQQKYIQESAKREEIIQNKVVEQTKELSQAIATKELLLEEVQHRVKNNLQIILSIIQLQNDNISDEKKHNSFIDLENRINAIAKTYEMLMVNDQLEALDMNLYISALIKDITFTLNTTQKEITIDTHIHATLTLREAVYVGLIVNEALTNAYKYAFPNDKGNITIELLQSNDTYVLNIIDNGQGFIPQKNQTSLGLTLIETLGTKQLGGTIHMQSDQGTQFHITFSKMAVDR